MRKRLLILFVMFVMLLQSLYANLGAAAPAYTDLNGHWAKSQVEFLTKLGVYKTAGGSFYPDRPISRGEGMALLNRVFEAVYGQLAAPQTKKNLDYRYPLKSEIEGLLTNLNTMLHIQSGFVSDYEPGDRMLYYLYLSTGNQPMKQPQMTKSSWWLSSRVLQQPLTREEASMLLFHMLAPIRIRTADLSSDEMKSYFTGYYQWKHKSAYPDTSSPYATAIREYYLFGSSRYFEPEKQMTRGQFAVVLKRLYDFIKEDAGKQFEENQVRQQKIINVYLTAAGRLYEKQAKEQLERYFNKAALRELDKLVPLPIHDSLGTLIVTKDESDPRKLWAVGQYEHRITGKYEVKYLFEPDEAMSNPYGWKISSVQYKQK
jgi:hypothetical protein